MGLYHVTVALAHGVAVQGTWLRRLAVDPAKASALDWLMPKTTVLDVTRSHKGRAASPLAGLGDKGTDSHTFTLPAGHVFNDCNLSIEDGQYNRGARLDKFPSPGSQQNQIDVRWYFDGGLGETFIRYNLKATTIPLAELRPAKKVRGFLPSTSGFHFINSFSTVTVTFNVGPVAVPLQGANGGACGGMAFAVRDLYEAGFLIPNDTATPSSGPLYDTIMNRLRDSFNLPAGPQRYTELMDPSLPDAATLTPPRRGRADILREAWKQIRKDIDDDMPSAVGLVLVRSYDPRDIANNHQVLAYGYTHVSDREGLIFLYDPNFPDNDQVTISFRIENDDRVSLMSSPYAGMVGFFRNTYVRATPNRPSLGTNKKAAFKASNGKYIVAEDGGGGVVNANRAQAQSWETFTLERTRTGALTSGELINLKASDGQHYVVAENRGGGSVNANRINPLNWERFVIDRVGARFGATLGTGDRVTLRTDGDRFLVPDGETLKATSESPGAAAEFVLELK